jgi:hypothetical protein
MSSHGYAGSCPVCQQGTLSINSTNSPFEMVDTQCNNCGFQSYTSIGRITLDEFIDNRRDELESNEDREYTEEDEKSDTELYNSFNKEDFNVW